MPARLLDALPRLRSQDHKVMRPYRIAFRDPSLSRPLVATVNAHDADEALNIVRECYPWCEEFRVIE